MPFLGPSGEQKTKPTQHSVTELRSRGIQPDVIVCRSDRPISDGLKRKISQPVRRADGGGRLRHRRAATSTRSRWSCTRRASTTTCAGCSASTRSTGSPPRSTWPQWEALVAGSSRPPTPVRIGIDRQVRRPARRLPVGRRGAAPRRLRPRRARSSIDWIQAEEVEGLLAEGRLGDLDGIVIPGGFGERGIEGKIAAAGYAREHADPLPRAVPRPAGDGHRLRPQRRRPRRRQLPRVRPAEPRTSVIDLMDEQRDVVDMGGTCASAPTSPSSTPGSQVADAVRRDGRLRAPPPPLRGQHPATASASRHAGLSLLGHVARRPAGRVHRAARPPVLGRHPGPPGVQEPARPRPPAVPRARRRRPGPRRGPGAAPARHRHARGGGLPAGVSFRQTGCTRPAHLEVVPSRRGVVRGARRCRSSRGRSCAIPGAAAVVPLDGGLGRAGPPVPCRARLVAARDPGRDARPTGRAAAATARSASCREEIGAARRRSWSTSRPTTWRPA